MKILREFDAINYLRYASWYLEKIRSLEETCPTLYRHLSMGQLVVKDRAGAMFSAVAGDTILEQTQNRCSQGPGGNAIVGSSGDAAAVAEFGLLFHEILGISNLLQTLTNAQQMDHLETSIRHGLSGRSGIIFNENVCKLLDFVKAQENPFAVEVSPVPLHNIMTKHTGDDKIKSRILNALENGEEGYQQFCMERYEIKSKKLNVTLSKVNLPSFMAQTESSITGNIASSKVSQKILSSVQRDVEIATLRGMSAEDLFAHDFVSSSPLFDGNIPRKPDKSMIVSELETNPIPSDYQFCKDSSLTTHITVDFMSKV